MADCEVASVVVPTWGLFAEFLEAGVPNLGSRQQDDLIAEHSRDAFTRAVLVLHISVLAGTGVDKDVRELRTFGDAYEFVVSRVVGLSDPTFATMQDGTRSRVRIRPLRPSDFDFVYGASTHPSSAHTWRLRGATPDPRTMADHIYPGTLANYIVETASGEQQGLCVAYDARFDNDTVYLGFIKGPGGELDYAMFEGIFHFINLLFRNWPFRKLYAELPAHTSDALFARKSELFIEEGRLVDHEYYAGNWWDLVTVAIYRETWETYAALWSPYLGQGISERLEPS